MAFTYYPIWQMTIACKTFKLDEEQTIETKTPFKCRTCSVHQKNTFQVDYFCVTLDHFSDQ